MPCRSGWGKACVTSLPMPLKQDNDITVIKLVLRVKVYCLDLVMSLWEVDGK